MNLSSLLESERRARLAAERLLDLRQRELKAANRKLSDHARTLATEIMEKRGEVEQIRSQTQSLHGDFAQTREDLECARRAADTAETQFWAALQSINDGFAMFDRDHRLIIANKAYLSVFDGLHCMKPGISFHDIADLLIDEGIVDPQGPVGIWRTTFKARWDVPDPGAAILKLWNGQFIKLLDRRTPDGGIVTLAINQTEYLRTRAAVEAVPDGFVVFDQDDRLVMCNEIYRQTFPDSADRVVTGVTFEQILRMGIEAGHYRDAIGREDQWLEERMDARRRGGFTLEQRLGDGRWLRIIERNTPDGGRVGLRIDVTKDKQQQVALEHERERAETASRAKSNFLANMSHEIRTPMNGVIGMAEMLADGNLSSEQRICAETIKSSGEALLVIINDILDFSKIEAGRMKLAHAPFDLERCLHRVVHLLRPTLRDTGLPMLIDVANDLPPMVIGDEGRLRQIVTNLIGNAAKFTETGHIMVRVARDRTTGEIVLDIEDTGIGIPADKIDHVFGVFNQVDDGRDRRFDGTGLGLAIVRQLVDLMGGTIKATSAMGRGSLFRVRLPLPDAGCAFVPATTSPGRRAWLVGDDAIGRTLLHTQLAAMGVDVQIAPTGAWPDSPDGTDVVFALDRPDALPPPIRIVDIADDGRTILTDVQERLSFPIDRSTLLATFEGRAANDTIENAAGPAPVGNDTRRRLRVLAAEDNKTNRMVLGRMLRDAAIDLQVVENGIEAVQAFVDAPPDLVFMDISMPLLDGREAARRIRAHEAKNGLRRVPIHAMTAHALSGDVDESLAAGIDSHLTKPLAKSRLLEAIESARSALSDQAPAAAEG